MKKEQKPEMSEKSKLRFMMFKQKIKEELYADDEYIFAPSLKAPKSSNIKSPDTRSASSPTLILKQEYIEKEAEQKKQAKRRDTLLKLSQDLGIELVSRRGDQSDSSKHQSSQGNSDDESDHPQELKNRKVVPVS